MMFLIFSLVACGICHGVASRSLDDIAIIPENTAGQLGSEVKLKSEPDDNIPLDRALRNDTDDIHIGTSFVFAFPYYVWGYEHCEFKVTAWHDATVHVEAPVINLNRTDKIAVGTSHGYEVDCAKVQVGKGKENKGILITSDFDVEVEVFVHQQIDEDGDTFLVLPVGEDSTEFVTAAYFRADEDAQYDATAITVVASEPNTQVTFYRRQANTYILEEFENENSTDLDRYDAFTLTRTKEMTGWYVVATRPITVITGSACTFGIPETEHDFGIIYTTIPPVSSLGYRHILIPTPGRAVTTGYYAQVVAAYDNTAVTLSPGVSTDVLLRGQYKMVYMNSPTPTTVHCTQRCLVVMYTKLGHSGVDMAMVNVPSVSQMVSSAFFNTFKYTYLEYTYFVSILSSTDGDTMPEYLLDGKSLDVEWFCVHNGFNCDYVYANFSVGHGLHSITPSSQVQFLAWTWAKDLTWQHGKYHGAHQGTVIGMSKVKEDDELAHLLPGINKDQALEEKMNSQFKQINSKVEEVEEKVLEITKLLKKMM